MRVQMRDVIEGTRRTTPSSTQVAVVDLRDPHSILRQLERSPDGLLESERAATNAVVDGAAVLDLSNPHALAIERLRSRGAR
jgi:hypothetical protein